MPRCHESTLHGLGGETRNEDISLSRYVIGLRLLGHDFEAIALAFADGAVEALAAAGFRGPMLDRALGTLAEAMQEHAGELAKVSERSPSVKATLKAAIAAAGRTRMTPEITRDDQPPTPAVSLEELTVKR
ncbi:hypothetical protein [Methylocystis heyeri]|uniref:Uncharacterized protein n=1 Tax=Methylocystis heyeri TaxID=391905 RepID=A0A6B8KIY7_9HYPH|nr:hypothetical protein [Methylocystis heyeri]QGM46865.1 hypothetical protein H2LOC_014840 [Methylocystis heyeri]